MDSFIKTLGVPKEIKTLEGRVSLTPDGVREFERLGTQVFVEQGAGEGASISDAEYVTAGATIVPTAADAWSQQMVVKVKEPKAEEFGFLRPDLTLFTYLHLSAYPAVAQALLKAKTTAIAYETVQLEDGSLPLLAPMSEIAGRLATQAGAHFLERPQGGRGVLMGGAPGVRPAKVVVIGAGNVGYNAAWIAAGMQAEVIILDKNLDRLRYIEQICIGRTTTLASNRGAIERVLAEADLLIGAVLVAGARAPATSTAPISRSASASTRSIAPRFDASVVVRPMQICSMYRKRSRFLSRMITSACMPAAIHAALYPTLPAPITTTFAGRTPGAPPINTPRPPCGRSRKCAPA